MTKEYTLCETWQIPLALENQDNEQNPKKQLLESLKYLTDLARRVTQPPPILDNDPKIDQHEQKLREFIETYG